MSDDVILTAKQVAAWWNDGDDAVMDKRVRDSHEALRARLAEVEQALRELDVAAAEFVEGGNDMDIGVRFGFAVNRCRAVLDKGEPDGN